MLLDEALYLSRFQQLRRRPASRVTKLQKIHTKSVGFLAARFSRLLTSARGCATSRLGLHASSPAHADAPFTGTDLRDRPMTRVLSRPGPAPADDPLRIIAFTGVDGDDFAGQSVADAGDVNGGGVPDLIIGAFGADRGAFGNAGEAYIVFGEELRELATAGGVAELSLS
ncbi:MAG: integrin alpha, partial [Pseudomonadota bacterium]